MKKTPIVLFESVIIPHARLEIMKRKVITKHVHTTQYHRKLKDIARRSFVYDGWCLRIQQFFVVLYVSSEHS